MPIDVAMLLDTAIPHDLSVRAAILIAALGLDAVLGDPRWLWGRVPHPVVLFGWAVDGFDRLFNRPRIAGIRLKGKVRRVLGVLVLLLLVGGAVLIGGGIAATVSTGGMLLSILAELLLVAILLAGRSLADHVSAVAASLENETIEEARKAVSKIVGRNTEMLDKPAIARATIETTAESFSDGVIAPAFFYFIFGLPGIFAYKMLNTADSMVGYRTGWYFAFGWSAARLDDLANLIPARLSGFLIALAGPKLTWRSIAVMLRDAPHHRSPNAGWPEAAMAVQLGLSLAGPKFYGKRISQDREINPDTRRKAGSADITRAVMLMWRSVILFVVLEGILTLAWFGLTS